MPNPKEWKPVLITDFRYDRSTVLFKTGSGGVFRISKDHFLLYKGTCYLRRGKRAVVVAIPKNLRDITMLGELDEPIFRST